MFSTFKMKCTPASEASLSEDDLRAIAVYANKKGINIEAALNLFKADSIAGSKARAMVAGIAMIDFLTKTAGRDMPRTMAVRLAAKEVERVWRDEVMQLA